MPKGDKEILKADPEDGTTPIANLLLEALAIAKLSGKEKGIILYVWRRTYGWNKDGKRLKEKAISLSEFGKVIHSDTATASKLVSGLVNSNILKRDFIGPGKGYTYSMNTRVAEWSKGCINLQLLKELSIQPLVKKTTQPLVKNTTPPDTNLATPKERLNKVLKKEEANGNFDIFWKAYPKRKSKGQAEKAFAKVNPDEQLLAIMLATIERAKKSEEWRKDDGKFIPYPATWLNSKGWEDEFLEQGSGHKSKFDNGWG